MLFISPTSTKSNLLKKSTNSAKKNNEHEIIKYIQIIDSSFFFFVIIKNPYKIAKKIKIMLEIINVP